MYGDVTAKPDKHTEKTTLRKLKKKGNNQIRTTHRRACYPHHRIRNCLAVVISGTYQTLRLWLKGPHVCTSIFHAVMTNISLQYRGLTIWSGKTIDRATAKQSTPFLVPTAIWDVRTGATSPISGWGGDLFVWKTTIKRNSTLMKFRGFDHPIWHAPCYSIERKICIFFVYSQV